MGNHTINVEIAIICENMCEEGSESTFGSEKGFRFFWTLKLIMAKLIACVTSWGEKFKHSVCAPQKEKTRHPHLSPPHCAVIPLYFPNKVIDTCR